MHKNTLNPYLMFVDNTKEAMEFYQSILGGTLSLNSYGETGMSDDPEVSNRIIHAYLQSEGITIMASDAHPQHSPKQIVGNNVHLSLLGSDSESLNRWFNKLSEGGTIEMPLENQFWGDTYGMLTDKFGIHWTVNIAKEIE